MVHPEVSTKHTQPCGTLPYHHIDEVSTTHSWSTLPYHHIDEVLPPQTTQPQGWQFHVMPTDDDAARNGDADDVQRDDDDQRLNLFNHWCVIECDEIENGQKSHFKNYSSSKPNRELYRNFLEESKHHFVEIRLQLAAIFVTKG